MASPRRTSSLLLVASLLAARADTAEEDAALMRMLTLQRRSLVSDRPLPVGGDDADAGSCWYGAAGTYAAYQCGIPGPVCRTADPLCADVIGYCSMGTAASCGW